MLLQSSVTAKYPCCDMQILVKKNDTNTTIKKKEKKKKKELGYSTVQNGGREGKKEIMLIQCTFDFAVKPSSTSFHNLHVKDCFSKIWLYVGLFFSHFFKESIWRRVKILLFDCFLGHILKKCISFIFNQAVMKAAFISFHLILWS